MGNVQKAGIAAKDQTEASNLVSNAIAKHPVVIFSKTYCPFCHSAKRDIASASKSVANLPAPKIYELNQMGALGRAVQDHLADLTGRRTVPNVFIAGKPVGGGDEVAALARKSVLKQMLAAARDHAAPSAPAVDRPRSPVGTSPAVAAADAQAASDDLPVSAFVDAEVEKHPVVVFSKTYCPFCIQAKQLLGSAVGNTDATAAPPVVHELDQMGGRGAAIQAYLLDKTGQRTVPNIFIGGKHVGGCQETIALARKGDLVPMLQAAFGQPAAAAANGAVDDAVESTPAMKEIVFGAGCFWGVELAFQRVPGVTGTQVGYSNGVSANVTYEEVCSGTTQAAEVVRVTYDPSVVSLPQLLDVWESRHDPTSLNKQGNDVGTQYRSAVFYVDGAQRDEIDQWKKQKEDSLSTSFVSDIKPVDNYCKAEDYHQSYLEKRGQSSCKGATESIRCYG